MVQIGSCWRNGRIWPLARADYDDNREARGYVAAVGGRGPITIYAAIYGTTALNAFATSLADCDGSVFGGALQAASIVPTLLTVEGVFLALSSPLFGGYADLSPHRKSAFGITFLSLLSTLLVSSILFLSQSSDRPDPNDVTKFLPEPLFYSDAVLIILCLFAVVQVIAFEFSAFLATSYSPELTLDKVKQAGYIADGFLVNNSSQILFILVVTGLSLGLRFDSFQSGAAGGFLCFTFCLVLFLYAYPKLGERKEINQDLERSCCGLIHLKDAIIDCVKNYPDVFLFFLSWAFVAAGVTGIISLATTYLKFHLNFKNFDIQIIAAMTLLFTVPGNVMARMLIKFFNVSVKGLYIFTCFLFSATIIMAGFLVTSKTISSTQNSTTFSQFGRCDFPEANDALNVQADPGAFETILGFVIIWGVLIGLVYPTNVALFSLIIPGGQESTYFGIKVTSAKSLVWLPPFLFTIIGETGSLQWSLAPIAGTLAVGGMIAIFIDMNRGSSNIQMTLHHRRGAGKVEKSKDVAGGSD